ncbi:DUF4352 domain-containing protein [Micromonospora sp. NPDC003197]
MTTPGPADDGSTQSGVGPARQPGGSGEPSPGGPAEGEARHWEWAVDPPPPLGPNQEPMPDPVADRTVDEPQPIDVTAPQPTVAEAHRYVAEPYRSEAGTSQPPVVPRPPDWSTPETRYIAPSIGGPPAGPPPPAPPGAGQPPGDWQPPGGPPPPANRRLWLVLGIVAALLSCACVAAAATALFMGWDALAEISEERQQVVGLHQPARDGDLEFVVRDVECGIGQIGDPFVSQDAVGQFCVVELAVRNLGQQSAVITDSLQRAYGPKGVQFRPDSGAGFLANVDQQGFLSEIDPGNQAIGVIVFDIPPDSRIVRLELHATPTSKGVVVRNK